MADEQPSWRGSGHAGWQQAQCVSIVPRGQTPSWGASNTTSPACQGRGFPDAFRPAAASPGPPVCSSGTQHLKKECEGCEGNLNVLQDGNKAGQSAGRNEKQSNTLCLSSLEKRRMRANLTALYSFLSFLSCHRTRGNSAKLHHGRFPYWDGAPQTRGQVS